MDCGIYCIENIINNHIYIGSSAKIKERWVQHNCLLQNSRHTNIYLQNAWNKYEKYSFIFYIIEYVNNIDRLLDIEQYYLDNWEPEYNIAKDALAPMRGKIGEESSNFKLSYKIVAEIREKYSNGNTSCIKLAKEHSVDKILFKVLLEMKLGMIKVMLYL